MFGDRVYPRLTPAEAAWAERWFIDTWRELCENDTRLSDIRAPFANLIVSAAQKGTQTGNCSF